MSLLSLNSADFKENLKLLTDAVKNLAPNSVFTLEKGTYTLGSDQSVDELNQLLEDKVPVRQNHDSYINGMKLENAAGITLDFGGATLVFKGFIEPIGLFGCKNITVKNLNIDFERPAFSEGIVLNARADCATVKVFDAFPIKGNEPVVSFQSYDKDTGLLTGICPFVGVENLELADEQTVKIISDQAKFLKSGDLISIRHSYGYRPGISLKECENITIDNVKISGLTGMGTVSYRSKNIYFHRYQVMPSQNRLMSISADGIHLVSTSGEVIIDDCSFESMGDDAVNIHSYYYTAAEKLDEYTVRAYIEHSYDEGYRYEDFPSKGDLMEFVHADTLEILGENTVKDIGYDSQTRESIIVFESPVDEFDLKEILLSNISKCPSVRMSSCNMYNIRGRAMLIQTRNVLVEGNSFYHLTGHALHIDTAEPWMESASAQNVVIRQNRFKDCGHGATGYSSSSGVTIETECRKKHPGIHKNILIEDNLFIGGSKPVFDIHCASQVNIRNNTVLSGQSLAEISHSDDVVFNDNIVTKDLIQ